MTGQLASSLAPMRTPATMAARERFARDVVCLAGLPIDAIDVAGAVERLRAAARTRTRCFVSTPNLNFVMAARRDPRFRDSVLRSDLSLADGAPLVWMGRWLGAAVQERVAGADVFEALRRYPGTPLKVFFFGGQPGAAAAACRLLNDEGGGLRAVGHDEAGFGDVHEMSGAERIARINATGADFVIVSLGAVKGQAWIERNAAALEAPLVCHLGAVVNFAAGRLRRAPQAMRHLGLEWLWRIKEEPELWRRYARDGAGFARLVATQVLPARRARRRVGPAVAPALDIERGSSGTRIRLVGSWTRPHLAPLRAALAEAVDAGTVLRIDLQGVTWLDGAAVGLLALARGTFGAERISLCEVRPGMDALVRAFGAGYLLEAEA